MHNIEPDRSDLNSGAMLHCSRNKTHEKWSHATLFMEVNLWTMEHGSTVHKFTQHKKQQGAASCKPVAVPQLVVGPTNQKMFFLLYQTIIVVAVGEPHPQPQYQRAPSWLGIEIHNLFWFVFYGVISVLWLELWVWKVNSTCFFMSFFKFIYFQFYLLTFN